jgi:threonine/homoserine/homoserine lactone efflux protein
LNSSLFLKGALLGFSIAAPVGPIGMLCIRRSLVLGSRHGFVTGLGAATADAFYGSIAAFGLTFLTTILVAQQTWIRLIGGFFLGYLGVRTFFAREHSVNDGGITTTLLNSYTSSLFLTVTNPMTILSFAAAFASMGLQHGNSYLPASAMVFGVFIGSASWWLILSSTTGRLQERVSARAMTWINRLSGVVICMFALLALLSLLRR